MNFEYKILFLCILIIILNSQTIYTLSIARCSPNDKNPPILDTLNGKISGKCNFVTVSDDLEDRDSNVYSFLSIPYAQPPVGKNRFMPPKKPNNWNNTRDGTKWPNSCIQNANFKNMKSSKQFSGFSMWQPSKTYSNFSEDCLYLNIWIPAQPYVRINYSTNRTKKVPIVILIHDTDFISGTSVLDIYDPSTFVARTETIFVTFNYRLGVFGFLHFNEEIEGNQALLDQHLALKWVYDNADKFNGDKTRITLLGIGGGASFASYHLLYKPSWPLFNNVILQGGSIFTPSSTPIRSKDASKRASDFIKLTTCNPVLQENPKKILPCLQNLSSRYLNDASYKFYKDYIINHQYNNSLYLSTVFQFVIDGTTITEHPSKLFESKNYKKCSILTGFSSNEGNLLLALSGIMGFGKPQPKLLNHPNLSTFIQQYFFYYPNFPSLGNEIITNAILHEYTGLKIGRDVDSPLTKEDYFSVLSNLLTHQAIACPILKLADVYAKDGNNVFVYLYANRISLTPWPVSFGVLHGDELPMIMAQPQSAKKFNNTISTNPWVSRNGTYLRSDQVFSFQLVEYWLSFMKYDTPNKGDSMSRFNNTIWNPYRLDNKDLKIPSRSFLRLQKNRIQLDRNYELEKCEFWNSYLPSLSVLLNKKELVCSKQQQPNMV